MMWFIAGTFVGFCSATILYALLLVAASADDGRVR